ncbi:sarcosine oxidase subunit gamma [Sulfitobacter brevis]|uniref:Sarcosine oxidase subunit gamma n=1 Tax=Sulfitobacter brevis TaxID=74348 RepID=A0A1I1SM29_9RHOB|nr:sarcosine oxidase subunit gamma [Sulfitobacter brevis]SFD47461.1 sarcosine oxidase subunit gamma [Sulfitobacter brevis]
MGELQAARPWAERLDVSIGRSALVEVDLGHLTVLAPFGAEAGMTEALSAAHGLGFPKPNRATGKDGGRCIWFGRGEALLIGPAPDASLADHGASVDVLDAWAAVSLSGAAAVDVLARLVPVDLREGAFKRGHSIRTQVMHMSASITRTGKDSFLILVFRSMAGTLSHDLKQAMAAVAARG